MQYNIIYKRRASAILYEYLLNIQNDGYFLIPANVCPIVPITLLKLNKKFELMDVNREDMCMNLDCVYDLIQKNRKKYSGIIYVDSYGLEKNVEEYFKSFKEKDNDFLIIHDKCLTIPDFEPKQTFADLALFSTGYGKVVDVGMGGFAINYNPNYANMIISNMNEYSKYDMENLEKQYKKSIQKKEMFVYSDSKWLDLRSPETDFLDYKTNVINTVTKIMNHKKKLNNIYKNNLSFKSIASNIWRYNIFLKNAKEIEKIIKREGLFCSRHYASLSMVFSKQDMPNASFVEERVLNLFNDFHVDEKYAYEIVKIINEYGVACE